MFNWFAPRCPLDTWEKTWTETRMNWLAAKLGIDRLLRAEVIQPTDQYFPEPYTGSEADVVRMMTRLGGFMGITADAVEVEICADEAIPGAAGVYQQRATPNEKSRIYVAASQLADPMSPVGTLAHELAHEVLLGGGILDQSVTDHEWITDLLQVYLGVGIFAANATVYDHTIRDGQVSWWVIGKQGYLPSRMYGYALALVAWVRDEKKPVWTRHLRRDARTAFDQGTGYLEKTRDSLFRADTDYSGTLSPSPGEAVERLKGGTATVRLATLWDLQQQGSLAQESLGAVMACLRDPDAAVASDAARLLPLFGPEARKAVPALTECLNKSPSLRAGAAYALGELCPRDEAAAREVAMLLRDESPLVISACAAALAQMGARLQEPFTKDLLTRFEQALVECDHPLVVLLAKAILATSDEPKRNIQAYFAGKDKELRLLAQQAVEEQRRTGVSVGETAR